MIIFVIQRGHTWVNDRWGYTEAEKTPLRATIIIPEQTKNVLKQGNSNVQKGVYMKDIKLLECTEFGD